MSPLHRHGSRILLLMLLLCAGTSGRAQLSGVKTVPGDYPTLSAAVMALNNAGVGPGGVTINVAAGHIETISATIALTASGTAASPITIQRMPASTGANPLITAYTGGMATSASKTQDGIFRLAGADNVTIDGIDLQENQANLTNLARMEYGYALYKASPSDGCRYVTIRNCTISLSLLNAAAGLAPAADGSCGILMANAIPNAATRALAAQSGGGNSNNSFHGNTIQNCNTGIALNGYASGAPAPGSDADNAISGNTIRNFGGAAGATVAANGIRAEGQYNLSVANNTLRSNTGSGGNHPFTLRGIHVTAAPEANTVISNNQISLSCAGTTQACTGIENASGNGGAANSVRITGNTVAASSHSTSSTGGFYGILNSGTPARLLIQSNTISGNSSSATGTGFFHGIFNSGAAGILEIRENIVSGNSAATLTSGLFTGIMNNAAAPALLIVANTISGNSSTATAGTFHAINNTGIVTGSIRIDSNTLGGPATPYASFSNANSAAQSCVTNAGGGGSCNLSISANTFYNCAFATTANGSLTMLSNTAACLSQTISNNVFANLSPNTSGSLTLLSNNVPVGPTGTQTISGNRIDGTLSKATGGTLTLLSSRGNSAAGANVVHSGNNFSNISVSGTTAISGWEVTDGGSGGRAIRNNTFSNWTGGSGAITAMSVNQTGAANITGGNTISGISCGCELSGIQTAAGNDNISGNSISGLSTTGPMTVSGIRISAGTRKLVQRNRIYDLIATNASGTVHGMSVTGGPNAVVAADIYNNLIGNLDAPASTSADGVRGISLTSSRTNTSLDLAYNTILLNAASTGSIFGSSGIYHLADANSTTAALTLRNNIITNVSTPSGAGLSVAFRRSGASLDNYALNSGHNLFFAGVPAPNRLLFFDGAPVESLVSYKGRVSPRDAESVTEDLRGTFLSTAGASPGFLRLDPALPTLAESGGMPVATVTLDVDSQARWGSGGYSGTGSAPDIGADEFNGRHIRALSGNYTVGSGGDYPNLTQNGGLFSAINKLGLAGDVTVTVISNLSEDGSQPLNAWQEQGIGNYSLRIVPGSASLKTVSGPSAAALLRLQGVKRLEIDGRFNGAGRWLCFRNTNVAGPDGAALSLTNGTSDNTVQYVMLEAATGAGSGVIYVGPGNVPGGNSRNLVFNCAINGTVGANSAMIGVYADGAATPGIENTGNSLSGNVISSFRETGIRISSGGNTGWTIDGNSIFNGDISGTISYAAGAAIYGIRILGGGGHTVSRNIIGGSAANAGGTPASYTSTAGLLSYSGIAVTNPGSAASTNITGNTIANIAVNSAPSGAAPGGSNVFNGIETDGSTINIGGSLPGEGNTIGSTTLNGSISVVTTTASAGSRSNVRAINCNSTGGAILGNVIAGIDIRNAGTAAAPSNVSGIFLGRPTLPARLAGNVIGSPTQSGSIRILPASANSGANLYGIDIAPAVISSVQINGNTVANLAHLATVNTSGLLGGISNAGSGIADITNNSISGLSATAHTGTIFGIQSTGTCPALNISGNTIAGVSSASATGAYGAIINTGAVTGSITINGNSIGTAAASLINFTTANGGNSVFINNTGGGPSAALSIINNAFHGGNFSAAGSGPAVFIQNTATTLSQNISGNSFVNMNLNTSGNLTFISNNVPVGSSGVQNINGNSIITGFTKRAGGSVTLFNNGSASAAGAMINQNGNNFSNLSLSGTTINGWTNSDGGAGTTSIDGNTFSNWSSGSGAITGMNVSLNSSTATVSNNIIQNLGSAAAVTGINTGAGSENISGNIISGLNTSGSAGVTGINITGGSGKRILRNKIYDLQAGGATGTVYGISLSGNTASLVNIGNNIIGDLRVPAGNSGADLIRGLSLTATTLAGTCNVYHNTIHLNATSTGATFLTTGVYHTAILSTTAGVLNMQNNIISNLSTPKGLLGNTVAFRRSGITVLNYATSSNNNLLYAGPPGGTRMLFHEGLTGDQALSGYKFRVAPRDAASVTEDLSSAFLSATGSSPLFLHISPLPASQIRNGGLSIAGVTDDFDGQVRQGSPGYTGSGSAPDIGADEVYGTETTPPSISYTPPGAATSTANRVLNNVTISDASGVNGTPGNRPRIYYKRLQDANTFVDNTPATNGWKYTEATNAGSPFSFTIDYALLHGGPVAAGRIQYFIVAQDGATIPNTGINGGSFTAAPGGVALSPAAFPITGTINSFDIPFNGTYAAGNSEIFRSLTRSGGLFESINRAGLSGHTTIIVNSDLIEDGAHALNQWTETGAGNYTLRVVPDGATTRLISGDAPGGLIRINGAVRFRMDGSFAGQGRHLEILNANAANAPASAVSFINGSGFDSLRNCILSALPNAATGVVHFGSSTVAGGNHDITLENCAIVAGYGGQSSPVAVRSAGNTTPGFENAGNSVTNCSISGYTHRGIDLDTGSSGWTISGNSLYNAEATASLTFPAGASLYGIRVNGGAGYTITGNSIGGSSVLSGGANARYGSAGPLSFEGISLISPAAAPQSVITANRITRISLSCSPGAPAGAIFTGIRATGPAIRIGGNATNGNIIGANDQNGAIRITATTGNSGDYSFVRGIHTQGGAQIRSNQVAGFDFTTSAPLRFSGVLAEPGNQPVSIVRNTVGSTGAAAVGNSIRFTATSTASDNELSGIFVDSSASGAVIIDSNTVQNISNAGSGNAGQFCGIQAYAPLSGRIQARANAVRNVITNGNGSATIMRYRGMLSSAPADLHWNVIERITLGESGANAGLRGIELRGPGAASIQNNEVAYLSSGSIRTADILSGGASGHTVVGILLRGAQPDVQNNVIHHLCATAGSAQTCVTAIGVESGSGNVAANRINNLHAASGSVPGLTGIHGESSSLQVWNNAVNVDNSGNPGPAQIYGIAQLGNGSTGYYFNTVLIGGWDNSATTRSAALVRTGTGNVMLRNNVLINLRGGNSLRTAISNFANPAAQNWPSTASDHNNLYSAGNVAEWGLNNPLSFAGWQAASGGDQYSVSRTVSFRPSLYDLEPDGTSNCALDGSGIAIAGPAAIGADIRGLSRSAQPDLGAYEFNYSPFTVKASSDGPVCAAANLSLNADAGTAIAPVFSWSNPANAVISTEQNPVVTAQSGVYKLSVTDANGCTVSDSTLVTQRPRPGLRITGPATACEGGQITINLAASGTGIVSGSLSNGQNFSVRAPGTSVTLSPVGGERFFVTSLRDSSCAAILPDDAPDTLTVSVIQSGLWSGAISSDWNTPGNWLCGGIPYAGADITVPAGRPNYPRISNLSVQTGDLLIQSGGRLTVDTGSLSVEGAITAAGSIYDTSAAGSLILNGVTRQRIGGSMFAAGTLRNLSIDNPAGAVIGDTLRLSGALQVQRDTLRGNGMLILLSLRDRTALISGAGAGEVSGAVTMQRYFANGMGYRYIGSPFKAATVEGLADDVDLNAAFPNVYRNDESLSTNGWLRYTTPASVLQPMTGYAVNFGEATASKTIDLRGIVNNGPLSTGTLYNHNRSYTQGFNLISNPYPSPVDWDLASGWTRSNIDNAVYYFNAGSNDRYTGSYSSYINGISSDGVANNIIPSMQGFFVHITNGAFPVSGSLGINNLARTTDLNPAFHRSAAANPPLVRIRMQYGDDTSRADYLTVYVDDNCKTSFEPATDALKLLNTDERVPNLFALSSDAQRLSIAAVPGTGDSGIIIPLGLANARNAGFQIRLAAAEELPAGMRPWIADRNTGRMCPLDQEQFRSTVHTGEASGLFLILSRAAQPEMPGSARTLDLIPTARGFRVYVPEDRAALRILNAAGQLIQRDQLHGTGFHEIPFEAAAGIYIVTMEVKAGRLSGKLVR